MSTTVNSPNGLLSILKVEDKVCAIPDCDARVKKGQTLCNPHYRLEQRKIAKANGETSDSEVRASAYVKAFNKALTKALASATEYDMDIENAPLEHYILVPSVGNVGFAYFFGDLEAFTSYGPSKYGKARTFGINLPSEVMAKELAHRLSKAGVAKTEKVTFSMLKVL